MNPNGIQENAGKHRGDTNLWKSFVRVFKVSSGRHKDAKAGASNQKHDKQEVARLTAKLRTLQKSYTEKTYSGHPEEILEDLELTAEALKEAKKKLQGN